MVIISSGSTASTTTTTTIATTSGAAHRRGHCRVWPSICVLESIRDFRIHAFHNTIGYNITCKLLQFFCG